MRPRANTIAPSLVAASAAILLLGLLHLLYTFYRPQLLPRDDALHTRMQEVSPVITRQTTRWKAWVGFNASHSYGLILFGTVYGSLALAHSDVLFQSVFFLSLGLLWLFGYVFLAKQYFFPPAAPGRPLGNVPLWPCAYRQMGLIKW